MNAFIELNLADGSSLDVPPGTLMIIEGLDEVKNPHFPNARVFARLALADGDKEVLLDEDYNEVSTYAAMGLGHGWIEAKRENGNRLGFRAQLATSRGGDAETSYVTLLVNRQDESGRFDLKGGIAALRESMSDRTPPAGMIPLPLPTEN